MRWLFVAVPVALALAAPSSAEACACCDGFTARTPIGWSQAGGALLIRLDRNNACEWSHAIEVWPIGAAEPSACYDLTEDPDKRVRCTDLGLLRPGEKPRTSSRVNAFPVKALPLDGTKARFTKTQLANSQLQITVEVATGGGWKQVWSDTINSAEGFVDGANRVHLMPVTVKLYPNARGDRALMLVANENTAPGKGHWATLVRWIELPKS
jgi:hypothetical protein